MFEDTCGVQWRGEKENRSATAVFAHVRSCVDSMDGPLADARPAAPDAEASEKDDQQNDDQQKGSESDVHSSYLPVLFHATTVPFVSR